MTSRRSLDTPAALICLALGVVVVAASLPFAIQALPESAKGFDIAWRESHVAEKGVTVASQTGSYKADITVSGLASSLTIDPTGACNDQFRAPIQSPATLSFKVTKTVNGKTADVPGASGSYTCATKDAAKKTVVLNAHPDVASKQTTSESNAIRQTWAGVSNETATYTLEVTPSRPAETLPIGTLPVAASQLTASVKLMLMEWDAVATPHVAEVVK